MWHMIAIHYSQKNDAAIQSNNTQPSDQMKDQDSPSTLFIVLVANPSFWVLIAIFFNVEMSQNQNQGNVQGDEKNKEKSPMT
ncbi:transmembrane protein, putative [Medicago truncatula]|uniref:Transmembrane protein, putative n=1 Tax=Medicago truncatula TaxID=3880 RepID=A0A072UTZ6_MEDTR|nr:transmembrane protein, putative [Medicago truncatula]